MKKSIIKSIALGIGGLLSLSFLACLGSNNQSINNKEDNDTALLETSVKKQQLINRSNINTEGTKLPSSGGTLASGTYYLDSDMTFENKGYITVAAGNNIIINLNGFSLSAFDSDRQPIAYVKGGTLTINGKDSSGNMGTLCNGTGYFADPYTRGGAIAVYADGTNKGNVTVNDCNITNNECNFGGAIFISKDSTATFNNCNISNNITNNIWGYRGVIYAEDVNATVNINGGEIYNNSAGVLLWDNAAENKSSRGNLNGVYIHDNQQYGVAIGSNDNGSPALTISGDTIIKNNSTSTTSGARANLRISGTNQAKFAITSELGDNASIGITMSGTQGVFTASADTSLNDVGKFFSDDTNYAVAKNSDGQLYLSNAVATVTSGATVTEYATFSDAVSAWQSASNGATLTLLKDSTIDSTISVSGTKTFDLNGCGINANGNSISIFTVPAGGDFTLNDSGSTTHYYTLANVESNGAAFATICDETTYEAAAADARGTFTGGYLTGANTVVNAGPYPGGGIYILANGVVTMNGGTIIGNIASNCAGGVGSYGKFIMNDGNVIYNRSRRGAVLANEGEMTINGGHISYNTGRGTTDCGTCGGIVTYPGCTSFIVNGGYFTNNFARYAGFGSNTPTISISGNPVIKDNIGCGANGTDTTEVNALLNRRSGLNVYIDIVGELTEGAEIGVTLENTSIGVITNSSDISYNDVSKFFSDADYAVAKNSDGQLYLSNAVATVTSGETVSEYSDFSEAVSAWKSASTGATLTLLKDVKTSSSIVIDDDITRTFDLNGNGILMTDSNRVFNLGGSSNITVSDSKPNHSHKIQLDNYRGVAVDDDCTTTTPVNNGTGIADINGGYVAGGYDGTRGGAFYVSGGTLTLNGGTVIGNRCDQNGCAGGGIYVGSNGYFTMNGGSIKYNYSGNSGAGIAAINSTIEINGGVISFNRNNWSGGGAMSLSNSSSLKLYGGVIENNVSNHAEGAISFKSDNQYLSIKGSPIVRNNTSINTGYGVNLLLNHGVVAKIEGPLTEEADIHLCCNGNNPSVITDGWSTYMEGKDPNDYFSSDNPNCSVYLKDGEAWSLKPCTVTFDTNGHGTAPDPISVGESLLINKPTDPTVEGYEFAGWFKEEDCLNAWDFATDTVTSNTTLYAKWFDEATANVIKLINDIGDLTYAGGVNDSLDDIIAAKAAYDALTPSQQAVVNEENKDVLDHDILTYRHVDNVADLIKEIPAASDSQEYYDAVEAALAAYKALTDEEKDILNAGLDFQYKKTLDDNIAAKEVIELIQGIGEVTYNGGQDDSKDDINAAEEAYNNLSDDQKAIIDNANKDALDEAKETYDNVDEAVNLINSIGDINHGGESDSKEAIEAAKTAYDSLTPEEKALVASYNNSEKTLEDAEEVYDVLVKIDDIGEGDDDEKIETARDAYDALTPEQKNKVSDEYFQKLTSAENRSREAKKQGNILFIVFLILSILLIVSGLIVLFVLLKRRKDENNSNNKQVKVASISGLLPLLILASYFRSSKFIIIYILAAVAIIIWLTNLILFVSKKRQKEAKVEAKPETVISSVSQGKQNELTNEDEEEAETITDEKGNIFQIRFIKSFTAKLIQSPDETKKYYEELKNEVLSYKKTNSRISWHYDAVNSGRNYVLKFAVRGKTLCVYLPLNADDYVDSKYKVEKAESKRYEDVPCLYRIKNDRRLGYAKELIAVVANNLGLEKGEEQHEIYSNLPYEPNKPLVIRGLIKELKVKVNKPIEAPLVLESKVNSEGDEVVLTKDSNGNLFEIRYIKSFTAKLSQSETEVKDYYTILKNYVLSYKGVHSRVSWHYDAINVGRDYILKFAVRGKTLCVYFALDASKLDQKYKVEEAKGNRYIEVPCLYRIKNDRRCEYAKELIDLLMKEHRLNQGDIPNEDYHIKKESTKALLAKGLIKEMKHKVQDQKVITHYESITVSKADEVMSDEKAESYIEEVKVNKHKEGSKEIINIDTLSEHYNNGDEVTLDSLIEKGLVPSKAGRIKVLARGELDKKLHVVANDYSLQAIKMIVLVGGSVKKIK